jgi:hypothetical protein
MTTTILWNKQAQKTSSMTTTTLRKQIILETNEQKQTTLWQQQFFENKSSWKHASESKQPLWQQQLPENKANKRKQFLMARLSNGSQTKLQTIKVSSTPLGRDEAG